MKINKKKISDWFIFILLISLVIATKPELISDVSVPTHSLVKFL